VLRASSRSRARTRAVRARVVVRGRAPIEVGRQEVVAPARARLLGAGAPAELTVSVLTASDYAALIGRITGEPAGVWAGDRVVASTGDLVPTARPPRSGEVEVQGEELLVAGFDGPGFAGGRTAIRVFESAGGDGTFWPVVIAVGLLGFLAVAVAFWWTVVRALRTETRRLLEAAHSFGGGDFGVSVPAEGNDEFALLGRQFNSMARQLESRLDDLQRERARLRDAIRRVGDSFAHGLDRDALLQTVLRTAMDGAGATGGRAVVRASANGHFDEVAAAGAIEEHRAAMRAAEEAVLGGDRVAEVSVDGASALAQALRARDDDARVLGLISVARPGRPFSDSERELFEYLSTQASVSIENVDLHETVQRQAVTDDLTGLFNHRHFQEVLATEVERAKRGQPLALVMLDIDDFKQVNDTYGHLQGDEVLRAVARVLRASAREIDEPARYGGEELAVALPQTDAEGAYRFAERVRARIAELEVPRLDGRGTLRVTTSCGVAALRSDGAIDKETLIAAADAALYEAKRSGKNRTVRAQ